MKTILHCDLNNFFASVECVMHPEYVGKPVAVAGDPEERKGVVLAKNYLAKGAGVTTGMTIAEAQAKCPDIIIITQTAPPVHMVPSTVKSAKSSIL